MILVFVTVRKDCHTRMLRQVLRRPSGRLAVPHLGNVAELHQGTHPRGVERDAEQIECRECTTTAQQVPAQSASSCRQAMRVAKTGRAVAAIVNRDGWTVDTIGAGYSVFVSPTALLELRVDNGDGSLGYDERQDFESGFERENNA